MNNLEKKMVDQLKDLKENHHAIGIKAEFEAEGTRLEEALRLKEVITKAGLDLTIKIGGCEALKDMYDSRSIGVTRIVGPMIETPYALKKFLACANLAFPEDERKEVDFLINVETISTVKNFDEMLQLAAINQLAGIVIGRVDMTGSLGLTRDHINSDEIGNICSEVLKKAKAFNGMECVIGGGVSEASLPFFDKYTHGHLDKFETRKVLFDAKKATLANGGDKGILKAVGFELMWLKNKRNFYGMIYKEDESRIEMLQKRYDKLIEQAGGKYD
jgi:4-hydroxy-2-oxoheptanedioate aldolase